MKRNPYEGIPGGQPLTVTSEDFLDGEKLPLECTAEFVGAGGKDITPQLSWSEVPEGTKSIYIHMYDPDAPTPAGWWHWSVANLPADLRSLDRGAAMPEGAVVGKHDGGGYGYLGSAPPAGHGPHRYFFTVHALDTVLDLDENASATAVAFYAREHVLARGTIVGLWEN